MPASSRRALGGLALGLAACGPQAQTLVPEAIGCDDRELAAGEARVKRVDCSEERVNGGEGADGDWVLDNAVARYIVRFGTGLTRYDLAGGTVVDASRAGQRDGLREAIPLFAADDGWASLAEATLTPFEGAGEVGLVIEGRLPDGAPAAFTWTLRPDDPTLHLDGAEALDVLPLVPSVVVGDLIEVDPDEDGAVEALLFADGDRADLGGTLRYEGATGLTVASRSDAAAVAWPTGPAVAGESDGDWVEALDADGAVLGRLQVEGLAFSGTVSPATAALRAVAAGARPGEPAPPGLDVVLPLGPRAHLSLQVTDDAGAPLPATVLWQGRRVPLPPGGGVALLEPGLGPLHVTAGPAYGAASWEQVRLLGEPALSVILPRVHADGVGLARIGLPVSPQEDTRVGGRDAVSAAVADGAQLAVVVAEDEVGVTVLPTELDRRLVSWGGSRSTSASGASVQAWPLGPSSRRPAHGAPPPSLDAHDTLAFLARSGRRSTVNAAWVAEAGPPWTWPTRPTALELAGPDDAVVLLDLLAQGADLAVVGPVTWLADVPTLDANAVEVERALTTGPTVAGNGPHITVALDYRAGPRARGLTVTCTAPAWIPLNRAHVWASDGALVATLEADAPRPPQIRGRVEVPVAEPVVVTCEGDTANPPLLDAPAWAVHSPVWPRDG